MITKENFRNKELYSIEPSDEGKVIHILAYCFKADTMPSEPKDHRLTEYTFCIVPLEEFIRNYAERGQDYVDMLEMEVKQYEADLTEDEAFGMVKRYFDGQSPEPMPFSRLTADTDYGDYIDC